MFRITLSILIFLAAANTQAECAMTTPEVTLKCYETYGKNKNVEGIKSIYWELKSFQFSDLVFKESPYKVIDKKIYKEDLKFEDGDTDIPLWAKKDNVELVSEKYTNDQKGTYSHIFRKIDGKWYMVSHYGHGVDELHED